MSYRANMHPKVSRAELAVFAELSHTGLTRGMVTQKPIILRSTIPDFCWPEKRKAVYLDGVQVHSTAKAEKRDSEIDELLELQGWQVLRIRYQPPLIGKALNGVIEQIKAFVGEA